MVRREQRLANAAYYQRNRSFEIARVLIRQHGAIEFLRELRARPCADCGGLFAPHQMDFDHRPGTVKRFNLTSGGSMLRPTAALLEEAAKCDVVCANCHRIRTWEPCRRTGAADRSLALHQQEARILARTSPDVGSHPRCAVHGLWSPIPAVRHGLRPSRPGLEAVGRHADDRSRWHDPIIGRGCGVRYRVRELPSASNLPKKVDRYGAGVAQLVERRPSKPQVAGSSPVSRSNP